MSIRGRYIIDRVKSVLSNKLRLPAPPYANPKYWEGVYEKINSNDVFEWADISLKDDLLNYSYRHYCNPHLHLDESDNSLISTTFLETIGLCNEDKEEDVTNKSILMLGCGISLFGEEIITSFENSSPHVIQIDVSESLIPILKERYQSYIQSNKMSIICDDAYHLHSIPDDSQSAVIDKGLIDSFFCIDTHKNDIPQILSTVHRVLEPGGVFFFLSFSHPNYLLPCIQQQLDQKKEDPLNEITRWKDEQIRILDSIYMYRYQKLFEHELPRSENEKNLAKKRRIDLSRRRWKSRQQSS